MRGLGIWLAVLAVLDTFLVMTMEVDVPLPAMAVSSSLHSSSVHTIESCALATLRGGAQGGGSTSFLGVKRDHAFPSSPSHVGVSQSDGGRKRFRENDSLLGIQSQAGPAREAEQNGRTSAGVGAGAGAGPSAAQRATAEGDSFYAAGEFDAALDAYSTSLRLSAGTEGGGCWARRGACLLALKRYAEAAVDCQEALKCSGWAPRLAEDSERDAAADEGNNDASDVGKGARGPAGSDLSSLNAVLCGGKAMLALGRSGEARGMFEEVVRAVEAANPVWSNTRLLSILREGKEGLRQVQRLDTLMRRGFANLQRHRETFYMPLVGRWRSWRKDEAGSNQQEWERYYDGETEEEKRQSRREAMVMDTLKCCQKALQTSPAATEPVVLQAWGLMLLGNISETLRFCEEKLQHSTGRTNSAGAHSEMKKGVGRHVAPEMWIVHCRALHLAGRPRDAKALLQKVLRGPLVTKEHGMPPNTRSMPGRVSERDQERLRRECKFEASLIDRLSSSLRAAKALFREGKLANAVQGLSKTLAMDPINIVFCRQVLTARAQVKLAQNSLYGAMEDATRALEIESKSKADPEISSNLEGDDSSAAQREEIRQQIGDMYMEKERADQEEMQDFAGFRFNSAGEGQRQGFSWDGDWERKRHRNRASQTFYGGANQQDWDKARMDQEFKEAWRRFARDPDDAPPRGPNNAPRGDDPFGPEAKPGGPKAYRSSRPSKPFQRSQGLYTVLGVAAKASSSEIKKAYMKLALKWHPDKVQGSETVKASAESKFKEISRAYQVLSDPSGRRQHDTEHGIGEELDTRSSFSFRS